MSGGLITALYKCVLVFVCGAESVRVVECLLGDCCCGGNVFTEGELFVKCQTKDFWCGKYRSIVWGIVGVVVYGKLVSGSSVKVNEVYFVWVCLYASF